MSAKAKALLHEGASGLGNVRALVLSWCCIDIPIALLSAADVLVVSCASNGQVQSLGLHMRPTWHPLLLSKACNLFLLFEPAERVRQHVLLLAGCCQVQHQHKYDSPYTPHDRYALT